MTSKGEKKKPHKRKAASPWMTGTGKRRAKPFFPERPLSARPFHGLSKSGERAELTTLSLSRVLLLSLKPPPGDASVEALKTENRERLFAFSIPQPPGDPKLLEVPVEPKKIKMTFPPGVAKSIGHLGIELLKKRHVHSGLQRRSVLPSVNLSEGLKVLGLVPYNTAADNGGAPVLYKSDEEILGRQKPGFGQSSQLQESAEGGIADVGLDDKMTWVMNTTYISVADRKRDRKGHGTVAVERKVSGEGTSEDVVDGIAQSFEAVKRTVKHPTKKGVRAVETRPLVPYDAEQSKSDLLQLQINGRDPLEGCSAKGSVVKQCTVTKDEGKSLRILSSLQRSVDSLLTALSSPGEEAVEVTLLMLPEKDSKDRYRFVNGYKYEAVNMRDLLLLEGEERIEYLPFSAKLALTKLQTRDKAVNDVLAGVKRGGGQVIKR